MDTANHPSSGEVAAELIQVGWVQDGHPSVVGEGWTQQVPPHCLSFLGSCRWADSGGLGTGYWSGGDGSVNRMTGTLTQPILSGNCTSVLQLQAVPFIAVDDWRLVEKTSTHHTVGILSAMVQSQVDHWTWGGDQGKPNLTSAYRRTT
jgi:hypothetical protein